MMLPKKKVLLFSTLNPYPFWAGSETYWFDFVRDERVRESVDIHVVLADSPKTREKGRELQSLGIKASFYKHYNVDFFGRNIGRLRDKLRSARYRTLPWYDAIEKEMPDLVWFCVSTTNELLDLGYAVEKCKRRSIPYWIVIQHSYESIFFSTERAIDLAEDVAASAASIIFIAERNQRTLERAIGRQLTNAFRSHNTLPQKKVDEAEMVAQRHPPRTDGTASFFNLGRFSPRDKGQQLLIEAFSDTRWQSRDWTLSFVGMNDFGRSFIERLAKYFGLPDDRLCFVAFTDSVYDEIAKHDVLVMPSLAEGTPYAMIESMACGRPAMGTPIGGIPELITDRENGWLARTVDISDVSYALHEMWDDRHCWSEMGLRAKDLISSQYITERCAASLLERMVSDLK